MAVPQVTTELRTKKEANQRREGPRLFTEWEGAGGFCRSSQTRQWEFPGLRRYTGHPVKRRRLRVRKDPVPDSVREDRFAGRRSFHPPATIESRERSLSRGRSPHRGPPRVSVRSVCPTLSTLPPSWQCPREFPTGCPGLRSSCHPVREGRYPPHKRALPGSIAFAWILSPTPQDCCSVRQYPRQIPRCRRSAIRTEVLPEERWRVL